MQTQSSINENATNSNLFIKMVLDAWETYNTRFNKILDALTDEQLLMEVAPGKNTGIYLTGHLIAVNDALLPLLGFEEKLYPQLENIFLTNPDKSGLQMPSIVELKKYRDEINGKLSIHFAQLQPEAWFGKHISVSTEAFAKEPHRNKLNIIINRTNHISYHLGQLAFLAKPVGNE
jgi:DinB superfamily